MSRRRPDDGKVIPLHEPATRIDGVRIGWVVREDRGIPEVDFPGNPSSPVRARVTTAIEPGALREAARSRQQAVLVFEECDPGRPVVLGLLRAVSNTPLLDEVLSPPAPQQPAVAQVDGKRVVIEGKDEVVLRCGKASITLRRNGRVVIRGVELETRARGLQRIKGGKIEIN